ncbi:hypothetical protein Dimus_027980 [Dionaea muscipula]
MEKMLPFSSMRLVLILVQVLGINTACSSTRGNIGIGGVIHGGSRVGKEQHIALKIAIQDYISLCPNCSAKLVLHLRDSNGNSASKSAAAMDLIDAMKVEVLVSDMTLQEAELISEINNNLTQLVPLLLLTPTAIAPPLVPLPSSNVIQISNDISVHIQCIAAIVGYFKWRRVTAIYEQANAFALNYGIISLHI